MSDENLAPDLAEAERAWQVRNSLATEFEPYVDVLPGYVGRLMRRLWREYDMFLLADTKDATTTREARSVALWMDEAIAFAGYLRDGDNAEPLPPELEPAGPDPDETEEPPVLMEIEPQPRSWVSRLVAPIAFWRADR